MEIRGKIIKVMPQASGISAKTGRQWVVQEFVVETEEHYPKRIPMRLIGDRVSQYPVYEGQDVRVSFDIDSTVHEGRFYPQITAWKVEGVF